MKILILFALTIAATAQAQQHPADCLKLKKVEIASHVIHQQSQTLAELTLKVKNCHIVEEHEQTTITFESKPAWMSRSTISHSAALMMGVLERRQRRSRRFR